MHMHIMVEASERGVALRKLAFEDHCELCDAVQRRHGMLTKPTMGHSLRELAKLKLPLVGSTRFTMKYRWPAPKPCNANLGIRRVGKPQDVIVCLQKI